MDKVLTDIETLKVDVEALQPVVGPTVADVVTALKAVVAQFDVAQFFRFHKCIHTPNAHDGNTKLLVQYAFDFAKTIRTIHTNRLLWYWYLQLW